jgi:hypothetical protein
MVNRLFGGNGSSKGYTNLVTLGPGWVPFMASESDPPSPDVLPYALSQGLEQWSKGQPGVRVRTTLPIVKDGNTIGIHIWYDQS